MKSRKSTPAMSPPTSSNQVSSPQAGQADMGSLEGTQDLLGNQAMLGLLREQGRGPGAAGGEEVELPYRDEMEEAFGEDLSDVTAYAGPQAAGSNAVIGARAFAMVDEIVFGKPNPSKETVAHEVAHVVQHRRHNTNSDSASVSSSGDQSEREASNVATAAAAGQRVQVTAAPSAGVQREEATAPFGDLSGEADWVIEAVNQAYDLGLVKGYDDGSGTYGASNNLTQPEFLTMVFRAKGSEPQWEDVMNEGRAMGAVLDDDWARALTRGEAARIICKIYGLSAGTTGDHFTDTSGELGGFIERLADYAVFRGDGDTGTVRQSDSLNRAEAAVLAVRVCGVGGQLENDSAETTTSGGDDDGKVRVPTGTGSPTTNPVSAGATPEQASSGVSTTSDETVQGLSSMEYTELVSKYSEKTVDFYLEHIHGTDPRANQDLVDIYETVTTIRDTVDTAIAVKDTAEAIDDLYSASTPAEGLEAYSRLFNSVKSLVPGIPGVSTFLDMYGDALEQIAGKLSDISDIVFHDYDMAVAQETSVSEVLSFGAHTGTWPGGLEMAEYMVALMSSGGSMSVEGKDNVIDWVVNNHDQLSWLTGEEPPASDGFLVFSDDVDEAALADWFYDHRDVVWQVLYGDAKP